MTLSHWLRFNCNVAVRGETAAVTEHEWQDALVEEGIPEGEHVTVGLDLGWKHDTTAMVPLWIHGERFRLFGPATIIVPPRDGNNANPNDVKRGLEAIHRHTPIDMVVMDMTDGAEIAHWLKHEMDIPVVDRPQTNNWKALDYARFMEGLRNGWLKHSGDAGLKSHVMNAVAQELPGGDIVFARPAKSRTVGHLISQRRVIDALVAACMVHTAAVAEMEAEPEIVSQWAWA